MRPSAAPALLLLSGCWKTDDPGADYQTIPLHNEHVSSETIVVSRYQPAPPLLCPDGEPATFYAVYDSEFAADTGSTEEAPLAIVFHSGAFDYVKNPAQENYLVGTHFAPEDRLDLGWAQLRVFSTLGMWEPEVEPAETHTGALVTALAQQGKLVLLPVDCWGDLWHGYSGRQENDYATERFYREGLAMASWMYRMATDAVFAYDHGIILPLRVDTAQIGLIGLGDGGRAVAELLWLLTEPTFDGPDVHAVLVDSSPDDLAYYLEQPTLFADTITGLERIWDEDIATIGDSSLRAYHAQTEFVRPAHTMVVWSTYDPEVPTGAQLDLVQLVQAMEAADPTVARVEQVDASAHVFTNKDMPLAYEVASFLYD